MDKKTIHLIGQAHLDPVWLWNWTEGRAEALATSQSAVDRLEEYPGFHFTRGEAQVYRWVEEENPKLFAKIKALVQQQRWHVVNGMIVQPDMNLPQGESFVRHFLLGKRYLQERLGVDPRIAYCVDSFGHAATLPQIFKKCGCDAYVFMRPGAHEMELPAQLFWWTSPDGSRVLAFRIAGAYATRSADQAAHLDRTLQAMPDWMAETMCFFGVGNHGGGPTKAQIENMLALANERAEEQRIFFSAPQRFFERVFPQSANLPAVTGDLYYHAVGCYAANSQLKRAHRQAECALLQAERMAALAKLWTDEPVPAGALNELWWTLGFNQFHDILGGCTIKAAADDAIQALHGVSQSAKTIINTAGRLIAARVNTLAAGGGAIGGAVILFNPAGDAYDGYIEYEPWTEWEPWQTNGWALLDEHGSHVKHQLISTDEALSRSDGGHGLCRLLWRAQIPALGYRLYRFAPGANQGDQSSNEPPEGISASPLHLQNDCLRAEFDAESGEIISCRLLPEGIELVGSGKWNTAQVLEDNSDTWSHGVTAFGALVGKFEKTTIRVAERGTLQASLLIKRICEMADGTRGVWEQQVILRHGEPDLLIRNWLNWTGRFKAVKLGFDLAAREVRSLQHIPFGWIERPADGSERPAQFWVNLNGESTTQPGIPIGVAVINDGKYSGDVCGSAYRQTVLRCPPYAYHNPPHTFGSKARYDWLDQGIQEFTLLVRPYRGAWQDASIQRRSNELNLPPIAITQHVHPGTLSPVGCAGDIKAGGIDLTALKAAESGGGYVLRLVEGLGQARKVQFSWAGQSFDLEFAPFEIKTLLLRQAAGEWKLSETDLIERCS